MSSNASTPIDLRFVPPADVPLEGLSVVPARAACSVCFVEARIDVSVKARKAGQDLAIKALTRELRAQGCTHELPSSIGGRSLLPRDWFR